MSKSSLAASSRAAASTLVTLVTLPCGCVSGVYQASPTMVQVELLEAKGPHCLFYRHRAGQVTRLGMPDWEAETKETVV